MSWASERDVIKADVQALAAQLATDFDVVALLGAFGEDEVRRDADMHYFRPALQPGSAGRASGGPNHVERTGGNLYVEIEVALSSPDPDLIATNIAGVIRDRFRWRRIGPFRFRTPRRVPLEPSDHYLLGVVCPYTVTDDVVVE